MSGHKNLTAPALTHVDASGRASMVDVSGKKVTLRKAVAGGFVSLKPETLELLRQNKLGKGDALSTARLAGIMAAKKTHDLIPLCHPLQISKIALDLRLQPAGVEIMATVKCEGKTGVEMEALTACSVAALTVYDMCKAVDKEMVIGNIRLLKKEGGRSGRYIRKE